jgi:hypothetical protein
MKKVMIVLKVDKEILKEWTILAKSMGVTRSEWIRLRCGPLPGTAPRPDDGNLESFGTLGSNAPRKLPQPTKQEKKLPGTREQQRPYIDHDPTCQCQVCKFRRSVIGGKKK